MTIDTEVVSIINEHINYANGHINLIASENVLSVDSLEAFKAALVLSDVYAEGYPNKRYYAGCQYIDKIEQLAIDRCKRLFGCEHANVQPHSGSQANMAVYMACLRPGDTVLAMGLEAGGHLTHGSPVNFSGKLYNVVPYGVNEEGFLDYDEIRTLAIAHQPKLIVCGASNYSRAIDFSKFKEIADEVGALLLADISHIAGIVATGFHMSPIPFADFVTTTTHKCLRGPRGAVIMCKQEWAKKIDSAVFPGMQGGPLEHVIAAKAVCFKEALTPEYSIYISNVLENASTLASVLKSRNIKIVSDGTDNHLLTIDLSDTELTGKELEVALDSIGITVNKNTVPNEKRSPFITSGVRIGTPAVTTRGFQKGDMMVVGTIIADLIHDTVDKDTLRLRVHKLCEEHPLHYKSYSLV